MSEETVTVDPQNNTEGSGAEETAQPAGAGDGQQTETPPEKPVEDKPVEAKTEDTTKEVKEEGGTNGEKVIEYTDFKLPEGMEMNQEILKDFVGFAGKNEFSQDTAQELVSIGARLVDETISNLAKAQDEQVKAWIDESKNDPDIGGAKFEENLKKANKALSALAGNGEEQFIKDLAETGFGNRKSFIKVFLNVYDKISEDVLVGGDKTPPEAPKKFYTNSPELKP